MSMQMFTKRLNPYRTIREQKLQIEHLELRLKMHQEYTAKLEKYMDELPEMIRQLTQQESGIQVK